MMRAAGIAFALCAALGAHAAETAAERGKRVVYDALQALGGNAFLKMEDRVETGRAYSFYGSELSGLAVAKIYTRYPTAADQPTPGKLRSKERESFFAKAGRKEEDAATLFTPAGAWQITYRGALPLEDKRYANYTDATLRNIFYILRCRLDEPGLEFYSRGADRFENLPVEIVDITDSRGETVTVYFGQSDKLPVRQEFKRRNPEFKDFDTEVTRFAKYRDVGGGVKWPLDIQRERNGDKIYQMFAESVEINRNLTDDLFTLPVNIKMLPKPK